MLVALLATYAMIRTPISSAVVRVPVAMEASEGLGATFESAPITPGFDWDEAIPSWNVANAQNAKLVLKLRAVGEGKESEWYEIAVWHGDMAKGPRSSVSQPANADGQVLTDVLRMDSPFRAAKARLELRQVGPGPAPKIKLFTICFAKRGTGALDAPSIGEVEPLAAPQIGQGPYEFGRLAYPKNRVSEEFESWFKGVKGAQYCSPTSLTMVLKYWSAKLNRQDLNVSVPDSVAGVFDSQYPGTGNWSFNVAYAGSFPGMRSYVTRLRGLPDLKAIVSAGIPVVCSVSHNLVLGNGKPAGGDGHLVVVVGFTKSGDVIVNDPGNSDQLRRILLRQNFQSGWNVSDRTAYLCHPIGYKVPPSLKGLLIFD